MARPETMHDVLPFSFVNPFHSLIAIVNSLLTHGTMINSISLLLNRLSISAMDPSSDGAVKAKDGHIETGDAASELQKKIQNDSRFIKLIFIPKLKILQNKSKTEEKNTKSEALNNTRDGDIETGDAASELQKKIENDSRFIKSMFISRLKILQNKSKTEEKNTKSDALVNLKTEETNTTRDVPVILKRSNTIFGQVVRFIKDLPDWLKYLLVGLAWIMYPLYQRLRKREDEMQESVQSLLQVVERVAQVTEKLATDIAEALPSDHNLKGAVESVSQIAQKVEKDAETAQAFVQMVDDLGDELDEYLNPLIKIGDTFIQDKKAKKENKDQMELSTLDAKL